MKPFRTLASFQKATTVEQVLKGILTLTQNPRRHLRGPRFSVNPGTGKVKVNNHDGDINTAISACGNGLIDVLSEDGRESEVARDTRDLLNEVQRDHAKYSSMKSFATVSDQVGLKAFRHLVSEALERIQQD